MLKKTWLNLASEILNSTSLNGLRALASKNAILFFFTISKSNFIAYTIPFYNSTSIKKTLFLLKYYYFIFLYYFFLSKIACAWFHFPGLSNRFFFLRLPQPLAQTTNHKHNHIHKQTQTHADKKKKSSPEPIWNPNTTRANHDHDPTKPSRFETHRSKPIQEKSSPEPPQAQPNQT